MMANNSSKNQTSNHNCKIVIAGDGAVGKTTISQRLTGSLKADEDRLMTCGIDFHSLQIINGSVISAQIWDLGGQEQFRVFQKPFFNNANIMIIVYSVEWFHSFINLENWIEIAQNNTPVKIYLIGNKIDSEDRTISKEEAIEFAKMHNMDYFEISALKGTGFEDFKNDLIEAIQKIFCS
jgi:small GTP-binding protein